MIICLLIPLSAVSASDVNTTVDDQVLSATPSVDTLSANVNNGEQDNDTLSVQNDENVLGAGINDSGSELLKENESNAKSFNELSKLIKYTPNKLKITDDFKFDSTTDANSLIITKDNYEIDFNDHILDFSNENNQLIIQGHNVTIKKIKIINTLGKYVQVTNPASPRNKYYEISSYPIEWYGDNGILENLDYSHSTGAINWIGSNGLVNNSTIHDSEHCSLHGYGNVNLYNSKLYNLSKADNSQYVKDNYNVRNVYANDVVNCSFINVGHSTINAKGLVSNSTFINGGQFTANLFKNCTFDGVNGTLHVYQNNNLITGDLDNCTIQNMNKKDDFHGMTTIFSSSTDGHYNNIKVINITTYVTDNTNKGFLGKASVYGYHNCEFINVTTYRFVRLSGQLFLYDCYFENVTFKDNSICEWDGEHIIKNSEFVNVTGGKSIFYLSKNNIKFNLVNSSFELPEDKEYDGWLATLTNESYHLSIDDDTKSMIYNKTSKAIVPDTWDDSGMDIIYASEFGVENGDGKSNKTPVSLKYALSIANTDAHIYLVNNGTPWSTESQYYINKRITIHGNNVTFFKIPNQIFSVLTSLTVIENITLKECGASSISAPIHYGNQRDTSYVGLTFNDCTFINNTGKSAGVAIEGGYPRYYQSSKGLTFNRCEFINNSAVSSENLRKGDSNLDYGWYSAGAIVAHNNLDIVNCTFINNTGLYSGAIAVTAGLANINGSNFTNNSINKTANTQNHPIYTGLPIDAGALWIFDGTIDDCRFVNNTAPSGGAITMYDGLINNTKFTGNNASFAQGGAIFLLNCIGINNCTFYNNSANTTGGAIYINSDNDVVISNSIFECNNASSGSTIHTQSVAGTLSLIDSNFTNNTNQVIDLNKKNLVINGGHYTNHTGGLINGSSSMTIDNAHFTNNGGAFNASVINNTGVTNIRGSYFINNTAANNMLYLQGTSNIEHSEFINNTVDGIAVVYLGGDKSTVTKSTFTNNSVVNGTLYFAGDGILVKNSIFRENNASLYGGAIYIGEDLYYTIAASNVFKDNKCNVSGLADKQLIGVYADTGVSYNYHNVYEFKANSLLYDVFVVAHPEDFDSAETGDELNPVNLTRALTIVNDEGILHFINSGDVFNEKALYSDIKIGLTFEGNNTTINGSSFIVNNPNVKFYNITFANTSDRVIMVNASNVDIIDCNFKDNNLGEVSYGACIVVNGTDFNLKNTTFSNNKVSDKDTDNGGMVFVNATGTNIFNVTFKNNDGIVNGIVFTSVAESVFLENSTFSNGTGGNVLFINGLADVNVINNKFINNSGAGYGSGIIISDSECFMLKIVNNTFFLNNAMNGGAVSFINNYAQRISFTNNTFRNNTAIQGGALFINEIVDFSECNNNNFYNNSATYGGAVYVAGNNVVLNGMVFTGNNATDGGAVYVAGDNVVLNGIVFTGNNATDGGALYVNSNNVVVRDCEFADNTALNYGSAVYVADNKIITLTNTKLTNNHGKFDKPDVVFDDISYAGILPSLNGYLTVDRARDAVYYINRSAIISYKEVYITNGGTGTGGINDPTNWENAITKILKDGIIYIVTDNFKVNNEMIKLLEDANLTNVTIVGINKTKITRDGDVGKYLFNPQKQNQITTLK